MERAISALGILVFIGISYTFSVNRQAVRWRLVGWGLGLEFALALVILRTPWGLNVFKFLGDFVSNFLAFSDVGAKFVFGENFKDSFLCLPSATDNYLFLCFHQRFVLLRYITASSKCDGVGNDKNPENIWF